MNDFTRELIAICRTFGVIEREAVCCGSVTVQQCVALQDLLEGSSDVAGLAGTAGVTSSAMTRLVDGLERRGWVTRRRADDDRRRIVVELTRAGHREAERLRELTDRSVNAVLSHIPQRRHAQVLESLRLIRAAVEQARGTRSGCCAAPRPLRT